MNNSESARQREAESLRKWFSSQRRFGSWAAMERALNITKKYLLQIKDGKRRAIDPGLRSKLHNATGLEEFKPISIDSRSKPYVARQDILKGAKSSRRTQRMFSELPANLSEELTIALRRLGLTIAECGDRYRLSPNMLKKYKRGAARPQAEKNVKAVMTILQDAQRVQSVAPRKPMNRDNERAKKVKRLLVLLANELEYFKQSPEPARETFRKLVPGEDVGYITTLLRALYNEDQFQRWLLFSKYKMKSDE